MTTINLPGRSQLGGYPRQFWVLFWGVLINTAGSSMVWPFMTIYLRQKLDVPLTTVTLLMTLSSAASLAAVAVAGPVVDRFGRKGAMVLGLASGAAVRLAMSVAGTLPAWAVVMGLHGAVGPLYQVGADSMIADLIPPERRVSAYALMRMISNLGIAIGPAVGGFVAATSYSVAFYIAAGATTIYALLILILARETIPRRQSGEQTTRSAKQADDSLAKALASPGPADLPRREGGYRPVLRDRRFLGFCGLFSLVTIAPSMVMVLLPVYAKEQFGVPENQYGFIMATNAAMVVLFQYLVTQATKRRTPGWVLAAGALFYGVGAGSVAWGSSFVAFWLSMVILTIGELLLMPTSTALVASLAPVEMRGRYMGLYNLTWSVAYGLGPVLGGVLNDQIAPAATWYGGMAAGLMAMAGFMLMASRLGKELEPRALPT
ncbi:MAG: MFS transporter [Anaerolineae bacterium]|nr:MFS transporter [Anaerolineae bacterium]